SVHGHGQHELREVPGCRVGRQAGGLEPGSERVGALDGTRGDLAQPLGTEGTHVDRGHQRGQLVVRADVRLRAAAADVLLTGLEGEHEGPLAVYVRRLTDD